MSGFDTNSLSECSRSEFTNGGHAWGPNGQCSFCGVVLPPSAGVTVAWPPVAADDRATIQRLSEALKRCDSEAVWDDLVDMWLVPNEVMDEIRAALREAGAE